MIRWLMEKPRLRIVLSLLGAIFLGAVGSGVWEYILKPIISKSRNFVLNLSTLWIVKFKDSTYESIARGFHESSSNQLYALVKSYFAIGLLIFSAWQIFRAYRLLRDHDRLLKQIDYIKTGVQRKEESVEKLEQELKEIKIGRVVKISYVNLVLAIVVVLWSIVDISQEIYIHNATCHFAQLLRIDGPFITVDYERKLISRFSQIHSGYDYGIVISELESIAKAHEQKYPEFSQW